MGDDVDKPITPDGPIQAVHQAAPSGCAKATSPGRPAFCRSEDWLAVSLGFVVIGLVLAGLLGPVPGYKWADWSDLGDRVLSPSNLGKAGLAAVTVFVLASLGAALMGAKLGRFLAGFPAVYALALVSLVVAGNAGVNAWGLEYVLFALLIGLIVGNCLGVPAWLGEAVRTEFYIKIGLVILGASILFGDILEAGQFGLIQALLVVSVVWFVAFWLAKRLDVDDELAVMLSTAVSICGVSAAIAACGAIQGDRKKLSYVTSLVLLVALPMMVLMPWVSREAGMPDMVAGAWLGGTLDTSGSVVAAGSLISETAMKAGTIVKMSQNVLIGVAAFFLSVWWTFRRQSAPEQQPRFGVIWERFPKFVLGFVAASVVSSFCLEPSVVKHADPVLKEFRNLWFALAFTCIGLETRFGELFTMESGRPALAFITAQLFNVVWTLLLAFLLFGGILFTAPRL